MSLDRVLPLLAQVATPTAVGSGGNGSTVWTAVSAVGAIIAAGVAVIALIYARRSAKASQDSAKAAKEANEIARAQYLLAREGIEIDRSTAKYQQEADRQARLARVVLTSNGGRTLWVYNTGDGFGRIGVRAKNEGRAIARDVQMEVYRNGQPAVVERGKAARLGDEPVRFQFRAPWKEGKLPIETDIYKLRFTYTDDLDTHTFSRCYRFTGGECPAWTAVAVDCPSDGEGAEAAG